MKNVLPFEYAVQSVVATLRTMIKEEKSQEEQRGAIKQRLFDLSFFEESKRPAVIKEINAILGTKWTMTQIRKSPTLRYTLEDPMVEVTSLSATVDVKIGENGVTTELVGDPVVVLPQSEPTKEVTEMKETKEVVEQAPEVVTTQPQVEEVQVAPAEVQPEVVIAPVVKEEAVVVEVEEKAPATTVKEVIAATEENAVNTNTANEEVAMNINTKIAVKPNEAAVIEATEYFTIFGLNFEEGMNSFDYFIDTHAELADKCKSVIAKTGRNDLTPAQRLVVILNNSIELKEEIDSWTAEFSNQLNAPKSFAGLRNGHITGRVICTNAALVGAGIEAIKKGGVTRGSLIGAAVGVAASYFAGKLIDEKMEAGIGKKVISASVGSSLGSSLSRLGRNLSDRFFKKEEVQEATGEVAAEQATEQAV